MYITDRTYFTQGPNACGRITSTWVIIKSRRQTDRRTDRHRLPITSITHVYNIVMTSHPRITQYRQCVHITQNITRTWLDASCCYVMDINQRRDISHWYLSLMILTSYRVLIDREFLRYYVEVKLFLFLYFIDLVPPITYEGVSINSALVYLARVHLKG